MSDCNCSCPPGTRRCMPATSSTASVTLEDIRRVVREEIRAAKADPSEGKRWGVEKWPEGKQGA